MTAPARPGALTVRSVRFAYPDDLEVAWNPRLPELACAANGVSLLMPYAEPFFVRSIRSTLDELDPALERQTRAYLHQELAHHVAHRDFNLLLGRRCPGVARVERWARRSYSWFGRTRSRRFNVAFAAGSETIAFAMARWIDRHVDDLFDGADPVVTTLFLWHLGEEVEHKTAAYDVFEAVDGSRLRYAWASTVSLALLFWFTTAASVIMLRSQRRLRYPVTWFRLLRWSISLAFTILPTLAASALPGHHPRDLADPPFLTQWLKGFDPETATMPVWSPAPRP